MICLSFDLFLLLLSSLFLRSQTLSPSTQVSTMIFFNTANQRLKFTSMLPPWNISTLVLVTLLGLCTFAVVFTGKIKGKDGKKGLKQLPPGPFALPIIGNLHMLGDLPHRELHRLAKKYGPIMHLRLGSVPTIVVSSPDAAKLFLKTHGSVFSSRPQIQASEYVSYGSKGLGFAEYGPYWRNIRKLCTLELLTAAKIELFKPVRNEEVKNLVKEIKVAADAGEVVDLTAKVESVIEAITYRMIFGIKDGGFDFKRSIGEGLTIAGAFNLNDFVPFLAPLDLQGFTPRMKKVSKDLDILLEKIIDEHEQVADDQGQQRDFIDILLSLMKSDNAYDVQLDRECIKAILIDLLAAGLDTSATVILWTFSELMRHPYVMKKIQEELSHAVGKDKTVEEIDLVKLEYLNMVIKESMRLHPAAPLLVPRESIEDAIVDDYYIPKKARLIINAWAIGRDPNVWSDNLEEFDPSRFANCDINLHGHDFQLIPFGSGRRGCPGLQLGLRLVQIVLAQLLHCFNWKLPKGVSSCDVDMSEKFGLVVSRAKHLQVMPTYCLKAECS